MKLVSHMRICKRGGVLTRKCVLCGSQAESTCHLLLHCHVTARLWHLYMNMIGLQWAMPRTTDDLLRRWTERELGRGSFFGGILYLLAYGGLYGTREIEDALKIVSTPFTR